MLALGTTSGFRVRTEGHYLLPLQPLFYFLVSTSGVMEAYSVASPMSSPLRNRSSNHPIFFRLWLLHSFIIKQGNFERHLGELLRCLHCITEGLLRWLSGKESTFQWRRCKRHRLHLWVRKIPWSRKWQPTPVFLPGKFLAGYSPWCRRESDITEQTYTLHNRGHIWS